MAISELAPILISSRLSKSTLKQVCQISDATSSGAFDFEAWLLCVRLLSIGQSGDFEVSKDSLRVLAKMQLPFPTLTLPEPPEEDLEFSNFSALSASTPMGAEDDFSPFTTAASAPAPVHKPPSTFIGDAFAALLEEPTAVPSPSPAPAPAPAPSSAPGLSPFSPVKADPLASVAQVPAAPSAADDGLDFGAFEGAPTSGPAPPPLQASSASALDLFGGFESMQPTRAAVHHSPPSSAAAPSPAPSSTSPPAIALKLFSSGAPPSTGVKSPQTASAAAGSIHISSLGGSKRGIVAPNLAPVAVSRAAPPQQGTLDLFGDGESVSSGQGGASVPTLPLSRFLEVGPAAPAAGSPPSSKTTSSGTGSSASLPFLAPDFNPLGALPSLPKSRLTGARLADNEEATLMFLSSLSNAVDVTLQQCIRPVEQLLEGGHASLSASTLGLCLRRLDTGDKVLLNALLEVETLSNPPQALRVLIEGEKGRISSSQEAVELLRTRVRSLLVDASESRGGASAGSSKKGAATALSQAQPPPPPQQQQQQQQHSVAAGGGRSSPASSAPAAGSSQAAFKNISIGSMTQQSISSVTLPRTLAPPPGAPSFSAAVTAAAASPSLSVAPLLQRSRPVLATGTLPLPSPAPSGAAMQQFAVVPEDEGEFGDFLAAAPPPAGPSQPQAPAAVEDDFGDWQAAAATANDSASTSAPPAAPAEEDFGDFSSVPAVNSQQPSTLPLATSNIMDSFADLLTEEEESKAGGNVIVDGGGWEGPFSAAPLKTSPPPAGAASATSAAVTTSAAATAALAAAFETPSHSPFPQNSNKYSPPPPEGHSPAGHSPHLSSGTHSPAPPPALSRTFLAQDALDRSSPSPLFTSSSAAYALAAAVRAAHGGDSGGGVLGGHHPGAGRIKILEEEEGGDEDFDEFGSFSALPSATEPLPGPLAPAQPPTGGSSGQGGPLSTPPPPHSSAAPPPSSHYAGEENPLGVACSSPVYRGEGAATPVVPAPSFLAFGPSAGTQLHFPPSSALAEGNSRAQKSSALVVPALVTLGTSPAAQSRLSPFPTGEVGPQEEAGEGEDDFEAFTQAPSAALPSPTVLDHPSESVGALPPFPPPPPMEAEDEFTAFGGPSPAPLPSPAAAAPFTHAPVNAAAVEMVTSAEALGDEDGFGDFDSPPPPPPPTAAAATSATPTPAPLLPLPPSHYQHACTVYPPLVLECLASATSGALTRALRAAREASCTAAMDQANADKARAAEEERFEDCIPLRARLGTLKARLVDAAPTPFSAGAAAACPPLLWGGVVLGSDVAALVSLALQSSPGSSAAQQAAAAAAAAASPRVETPESLACYDLFAALPVLLRALLAAECGQRLQARLPALLALCAEGTSAAGAAERALLCGLQKAQVAFALPNRLRGALSGSTKVKGVLASLLSWAQCLLCAVGAAEPLLVLAALSRTAGVGSGGDEVFTRGGSGASSNGSCAALQLLASLDLAAGTLAKCVEAMQRTLEPGSEGVAELARASQLLSGDLEDINQLRLVQGGGGEEGAGGKLPLAQELAASRSLLESWAGSEAQNPDHEAQGRAILKRVEALLEGRTGGNPLEGVAFASHPAFQAVEARLLL